MKYFMRAESLLRTVSCILTVTVTPYSSHIPTDSGLLHPVHEISLYGYYRDTK